MGTNPEDRCRLTEAEGEKWVKSAFHAPLEVNTETHSTPEPWPAVYGHYEELDRCSFWGRTKISGSGQTDMLVCGPIYSPEKASGENIFIFIFQAI